MIQPPQMPRAPEDGQFYAEYYAPFPYKALHRDLYISYDDPDTDNQLKTRVRYTTRWTPNPESNNPGGALELKKEEMDILSIRVNGQPLQPHEYILGKDNLIILNPPAGEFELETVADIDPRNTKELKGRNYEGIYFKDGVFISQCESHGFRRIAPDPDRTDVWASMTVHIERPKDLPVALTCPEYKGDRDLGNNRIVSDWEDPYPKPPYLFGTTSGDLIPVYDIYTSESGRKTVVAIYVLPEDRERVDWALQAELYGFRRREEISGTEYEYDLFTASATPTFVFGAMENMGHNIFNAACLYGNKNTATNASLVEVFATIVHENTHHSWGNRSGILSFGYVSTKEGANTLVEQLLTEERFSAAAVRIRQADSIRSDCFVEIDSADGHAPIPDVIASLTNIYDGISYEGTAEIDRMLILLLGHDTFMAGLKEYCTSTYMTPTTTWDYLAAMERVSGRDLTQFKLWYKQRGVSEVTFSEGCYDPQTREYHVTVRQHMPAHEGEAEKLPLHIPLPTGLIAEDGTELHPTKILELTESEQTFVFENVDQHPALLSFNRNFGAPVRIKTELSEKQLLLQMKHDTDGLNRYDAASEIYARAIMKAVADIQTGKPPQLEQSVIDAFRHNLMATGVDENVQALALELPDWGDLEQRMRIIDPDALYAACRFFKEEIGKALLPELSEAYERRMEADTAENRQIASLKAGLKEIQEKITATEEKYKNELAALPVREIAPRLFVRDGVEPEELSALQEESRKKKSELSSLAYSNEKFGRQAMLNTTLSYLAAANDPSAAMHAQAQYTNGQEFEDMDLRIGALKALSASTSPAAMAVFKDLSDSLLEQFKGDIVTRLSWNGVVSRSPVHGALENIRAAMANPDAFNVSVPNDIYATIGGFGWGNPTHFHHTDGSGYKFMADMLIQLNADNPGPASRIAEAFQQWLRFDPKRQSMMEAEMRRVTETLGDEIDKNLGAKLKGYLAQSAAAKPAITALPAASPVPTA